MKKNLSTEKQKVSSLESFLLLWGALFVLFGLAVSLGAYYTYNMTLRYIAFSLLVLGIILLFGSVKQSLQKELKSSSLSLLISLGLGVLYFALRTQLHRFDFGVGDASDYFIAGVCSVTFSQDIGFFLPLTASISALGYSVFGVAYAPMINVLLYAATIPLGYMLLRKLGLNVWISVLMTLFFIINPLSIWFSKTSFSEPIWQLMILLFAILFYRISSNEKLKTIEVIAYFLIVALVPFLRGEGALYYGLVTFFALYHFWKYANLKSALILMLGLFVIAGSIHLTLGIREHYLLSWQFSRVIPGITTQQLMMILYGVAGVMMGLIILLNFIKKGFSRIPFALIVTLLAIAFKIAIAYLYMSKKSVSFMELLVYREYGLALGNFGLPLTLLIGVGLVLLHYKAIKGEKLALLFVVIYAIFSLPFVMQGVTFHDPHELFLYWSRYYFSVIMLMHLFSLALVWQFVYEQSQRVVNVPKYRVVLVSLSILLVSLLSLNLRVLDITINEAYLGNSDKVFTWLKQRVQNQPVSVLYDDGIRYERHNGLYDAKVFTARMFTVVKIQAKAWQKIKQNQLTSKIQLSKEMYRGRYLVCISSKKPMLENKALILVDQTMFPISWREHYMAQPRSKVETLGDVSNSYKNELTLYLTLYKMPTRVR